MDDNYQSLVAILQQQVKLVNNLIELGNSETEALKSNEIQLLKTSLKSQQEPIAMMDRLDQQRQRIQALIEEQLGIKEITFKQILQNTGAVEEDLRTIGAGLADRLHDLQVINETNRLLIAQSLSFESEIMRALTGVHDSYNCNGQKVTTTDVSAGIMNHAI